MCVPYGTEATVYGSQIGKHPLDRETFLSKNKEQTKNKAWILLPIKIECAFIKWRDMQVNASLPPPPVWNMDPCLCNHDENLLYVYDKYSLI